MQSHAVNTAVRRSRWRLGIAAATAAVLSVTLAQSAGGGAVAAEAPVGAAGVSEVSGDVSGKVARRADYLGFSVQLGAEQRVVGPTDQGDNPYYSEMRGGKLRGFFGTSRTIEWQSHNNTRLTNPRIILNRGGSGAFDECGAWLQGTFQKITATRWIAFYHAEGKGPGEERCDHYANTTVWRMAMAETTNAGKTWKKKGVVLTGVNATASNGVTNAGTGRTVKVGNYYYMFFKTAHGPKPGPSGIQVARSKVSDGGKPGTWFKYYCPPGTVINPDPPCNWKEKGIGGHSTQIGGISEKARFISWNTALKRWIGFDASGQRGFRLFASEVGAGATPEVQQRNALFDSDGFPKRWMNWTDTYPLVSTEHDKYVDQWGGHIRNRRSKQLYAYPSVGGADGSSWRSGSEFYVYYVKLFPGDKFTHRYLFRRKVKVVNNSAALNRVELTLYKDRRGHRFSSTEAHKSKAFRRVGVTGYLLSHGKAGWKQVFDCGRRGDRALYVGNCKRGWAPVRRVGFIRPRKAGPANVPVYRCYDRQKNSHFASTKIGCAGERREGRIGFALRSL